MNISGGALQLIHRYRIPAFLCAIAVLVCDLISQPYTTIGIADDGPYILMAHTLATTGHLVYNGWAAPMLGWQLYLGAAFVKLFGPSFSAVRGSTIFVAIALAFILQRTFARAGLSDFNATLGTLALVLSPLYLMLSVTYMTDIYGLFAIVICLYGCIRALQASTTNATIGWLVFAVATNAIFGTSRQTGWLGILTLVPCTLWLLRTSSTKNTLRDNRRILLAGVFANILGVLFIFGCMLWLKRQPYIVPEELLPGDFTLFNSFRQLVYTCIDVPFLLLPLMVVFLPKLRDGRRRVLTVLSIVAVLYILIAIHDRNLKQNLMLLPARGDWVTVYGIYRTLNHGQGPKFLNTPTQIFLTVVCIGGLFGVIASLFSRPLAASTPLTPSAPAAPSAVSGNLSWHQLFVLLAPFTIVYILLLIPRAAKGTIFDRYLLEVLIVAILCLVRYYQERYGPRLPLAASIAIAVLAAYGVVITYNTFDLNRARVALAAELNANGVPDTAIDNGWDYNLGVELQHANHINFRTLRIPAGAYVPTPPPPPGTCDTYWYDQTPHVRPIYGITFDPHACYGPAPFAPVHYSRWPYRTPGTLYVVRYTPTERR
jgi:hypothetical protein